MKERQRMKEEQEAREARAATRVSDTQHSPTQGTSLPIFN